MTRLIAFLSAAFVVSLTGCSTDSLFSTSRIQTYEERERDARLELARDDQLGLPSRRQTQFIQSNYDAVDTLLKRIADPELDLDKPLIICTVVEIETLNKSSTLGKLISSHITSELQRKGYTNVMQLEAGESVTANDQGMLFLTRDARKIARTYKAQAVVVGTVASMRDGNFVHLEILDGNRVLSAMDYALPRL